jgi:hypothetical protein
MAIVYGLRGRIAHGCRNGEMITTYHVPQFATQSMLSSSANPSVTDRG